MLMSAWVSIPFLLMSNTLLAFLAAAANWDNDFRDLSMMIPRSLSWTVAAKSSCNSPSAHSTEDTTVKTEVLRDEWKEKVGLVECVVVFLHFLPTGTYLSVLGPMPTAARTPLWASHTLEHHIPTSLPSLLEVCLQLPLQNSTTKKGNLISVCSLTSIHLVVTQPDPLFYYSSSCSSTSYDNYKGKSSPGLAWGNCIISFPLLPRKASQFSNCLLLRLLLDSRADINIYWLCKGKTSTK